MHQMFPPTPSFPGFSQFVKVAQRTQETSVLTRLLLHHQGCLRLWIKSETERYTVQSPDPVALPQGAGAWPAGVWSVWFTNLEFLWRFHLPWV